MRPDAKRSLEDLWYFLVHYWGLELEEQPHRKMVQIMEDAELQPASPYTMLTVPRGCYKSSIARGAVVWKHYRQICLFDNPYHRTMVGSATLALGNQMIQNIEGVLRAGGHKGRLESDGFPVLWKERTKDSPGSKHRDGSITWAPRILRGELATVADPSLFVGSMRRVSTGFHCDEAFIDDLNNKDNSRSPEQRQKVHEYWRLLWPILGTKDRSGRPTRVIFTNTPWHDDDVRGAILLREQRRAEEDPSYVSPWRIFASGSYLTDGGLFFPSKYGEDQLKRLREEMSVEEFAANYLCDPAPTGSGLATEEQIIFKPRDTFPPLRMGRITVDPNQHKEAKVLGCYAAIVISGYDRFNTLWVIDVRASREWGTGEMIDQLFEAQREFPNFPIFIEDAHMAGFAHAVQMEEARRSVATGIPTFLRVHYVPIEMNLTKYDRSDRLKPRFQGRQIIFADEIAPSIKVEMKDEIVRHRAAKFHDITDALAMAETGYRPVAGLNGQLIEAPEAPRAPGTLTWADVLRNSIPGVM